LVSPTSWVSDRIFDFSLQGDDSAYPWQFLRQYLVERDIELQTYDVFERNGEQPHIYFLPQIQDMTRDGAKLILVTAHRREMAKQTNLYGDGRASERIVSALLGEEAIPFKPSC